MEYRGMKDAPMNRQFLAMAENGIWIQIERASGGYGLPWRESQRNFHGEQSYFASEYFKYWVELPPPKPEAVNDCPVCGDPVEVDGKEGGFSEFTCQNQECHFIVSGPWEISRNDAIKLFNSIPKFNGGRL